MFLDDLDLIDADVSRNILNLDGNVRSYTDTRTDSTGP